MHLYSVNLENTYQTGSANLSAVEQLELLGALIEVVAQGDAVASALDFSALVQSLMSTGSPALSKSNAIELALMAKAPPSLYNLRGKHQLL